MTIEYTGRNVDITPRIRRLVEEKIARLTRHAGNRDPGDVRVVLTQDKNRYQAEVVVSGKKHTWKAVEEMPDLTLALQTSLEKIDAQARKDRAKLKDRRRRPETVRGRSDEWEVEVLAPASLARSSGAGGSREIVKTSRIPIRPMTVEEAALQLEKARNEFIVFRDAESDRVTVLYKRRDENYGLISPEW
jgi:ribosome hibernation promoting factor